VEATKEGSHSIDRAIMSFHSRAAGDGIEDGTCTSPYGRSGGRTAQQRCRPHSNLCMGALSTDFRTGEKRPPSGIKPRMKRFLSPGLVASEAYMGESNGSLHRSPPARSDVIYSKSHANTSGNQMNETKKPPTQIN